MNNIDLENHLRLIVESYPGVSPGAKLLWLCLSLEKPEQDGFIFVDVEKWAEKTNYSYRQTVEHLKMLDRCNLIKKNHRTEDRLNVNRLFVRLDAPLDIKDKITFTGVISSLKSFPKFIILAKLATVCEKFRIENHNIYVNHLFEGIESAAFKEGDYIKFDAKLRFLNYQAYVSEVSNIELMQKN